MTLFRGDVEIVPPYSGDVDTWARDVGDWAYRYLQSHTEWLRVIQDIAPITTGLYWERNSSTATLTPVVANDNSDIGTGLLTCGNIAASGAITWSGGSSALTNAHIVSTGESHTYIDQSLTTTGPAPTFTGLSLGTGELTCGAITAPSISGSSGSCTGNAATVTVDATTSDTTCFPLLGESTSGSLEPQTDATLTYNASTGALAASSMSLGTGELTCGSINRAAGTLTLEIAGTPVLSIAATSVISAQDLLPASNATFTLGSSAKQWNNLHVFAEGVFYRDITMSGGADADFRIKDGATEWFNLYPDGSGNIFMLVSTAAKTLNILTGNDADDYIQFSTPSHVPHISTVGACNLHIHADGGTIDFDDEILTTTGALTCGAITAPSLSGTAATVTTNANLTGIVTSVGNATAIADKAIAIAKLADGTDGELITWSAAGVIETIAVGTATHVLTSNGVGAAPTFQAAAGGHTQGTDTTLGIMTADINMGTSYQLTNLAAPAGSGEAIRQTATITETNLTTLTNASNADALHSHTGSTASDIVVIDTDDTSCYIAMFDAATGTMAIKTDVNLMYNATTDALSCASLALTGSITMSSELGDTIKWAGGWQNIGINSEYLVFRSYEAATSLGFKFEGTETPANEYLRIYPNALDSASFNRWNIYSKENIALIAETDVVTLGGVGTDELDITFSANTVTMTGGITNWDFEAATTLKFQTLEGDTLSDAVDDIISHFAVGSTGYEHTLTLNQPLLTTTNGVQFGTTTVSQLTVGNTVLTSGTLTYSSTPYRIAASNGGSVSIGNDGKANSLTPYTTASNQDIGTSAIKWRDIHLSGAVNCATVAASGNISALTLNTFTFDQDLSTSGTPEFDGVGIGAAAGSTNLLNISDTMVGSTTGSISGIKNVVVCSFQSAAPVINIIKGMDFDARWTPAGLAGNKVYANGYIYGSDGFARVISAAGETNNITMGNCIGNRAIVSASLGATASGTVTITKGYGFYAEPVIAGGSAIVTTMYAFYDKGQTLAGTNWGFYGLSANNYMSGNLSLGTLSVTGLTTATGGSTTGDGTNKTDISATGDVTFAGTAIIDWTKYTAGAVDVTGFTEVGQTDSWLQTANDGTVFTATEVAGGSNDVVVNFTGVTAFNWVNVIARYKGSSSHFIGIQLEISPFDGSTWETFGAMTDQPADQFMENRGFFITKAPSTYINSGVVKVRLCHSTATVNSHELIIDEVALYQ